MLQAGFLAGVRIHGDRGGAPGTKSPRGYRRRGAPVRRAPQRYGRSRPRNGACHSRAVIDPPGANHALGLRRWTLDLDQSPASTGGGVVMLQIFASAFRVATPLIF